MYQQGGISRLAAACSLLRIRYQKPPDRSSRDHGSARQEQRRSSSETVSERRHDQRTARKRQATDRSQHAQQAPAEACRNQALENRRTENFEEQVAACGDGYSN